MEPREAARRMARECLVVRVRAVNRALTRLYDAVLRSHGLRSSQFGLLIAVVGYGPVRPADLAPVLELDKSTLSRDVTRLVENGWVTTEPHDDGRSHWLVATEAGKELLTRVSAAWEEAQKRAAALLGTDGVQAIHRLAARFFQIPGETE